jgi:hypothetical protein
LRQTSGLRHGGFSLTTDERYVDEWTLRARFRELDFLGKLSRGELTLVVDWERPARRSLGFPDGTASQRVLYLRGDLQIAIVHQYLLPDGRIGASGLPDPKWLRDGDTILKYRA